MRLPFDKLADYRGLVTLVDGSFDPLHPGHLAYFRAARSLGYPLLVNLCPDAETARKHPVLLPAALRAEVLEALGIVTYVHVSEVPLPDVLRQLRPAYLAKGGDWLGRLPDDVGQVCDEFGIRLCYTPTKTHSSSALLTALQPDVDAFERLVLSQQPASTPWQPVTDYSFEARKAIEGRHPELIKEVFQPKKATDVGCGHGHLMTMLRALGVDVVGLDRHNLGVYPFNPCDIGKQIDWEYGGFQRRELVICREVLEHLTIREIGTAVTNLCALSLRYVYLTTRFSQARHFLDIATSDDLDPTHISIMPQDWLRHLFVLEGFRRRADLEQRMDWQQKGRVLVYERA